MRSSDITLIVQCKGTRAIQLEKCRREYSKCHEDPIPATSILGELVRRSQAKGNVSDLWILDVHSADVRPPVRPMFFEFDDDKLFAVEEQFMVGPALLITPVLHEGKATVKGYFPSNGGTTWRDWTTGEVSLSRRNHGKYTDFAHGQVVTPDNKGQAELLTPLGKINVHIRSGSVILIHDKPAYSLTETRESPYGLVIHLDAKGEAKGEAVLDDGLAIDGKLPRLQRGQYDRS